MEPNHRGDRADQDARIEGLERQHDADQDMIETLRTESQVGRDKIENLEVALVTARRIGTAMGVLMFSRKISEDAAFELLREASQRTNRKIRDLAQDVLDTGALPD